MFPLILKDGHTDEPDSPIYYEVAANGIFEVRETEMFRSVTRVSHDVPGLQAGKEDLVVTAPRLPAALMEDVVAFFGAVYRSCKGEGIVVLFYNTHEQRYHVEVPEQTIPVYKPFGRPWTTYLEVRYDRVDRPDGFVRCGTIHSHADQAAYASHTDCTDEKHQDGLHAVVGDLHRADLSLTAAFTAAGHRFPMTTYDLIEPFDMDSAGRDTRQEWLERVLLEYPLPGGGKGLCSLAELERIRAARRHKAIGDA